MPIENRDILNLFYKDSDECTEIVSELSDEQCQVLLQTIIMCQKYGLEFPC